MFLVLVVDSAPSDIASPAATIAVLNGVFKPPNITKLVV